MKHIRTKFNVAMAILAVTVLAFTGIVLIINISIDYRRDFYNDVTPVFDSDKLPDTVNEDTLSAYIDSAWTGLTVNSDKVYYIFKDGSVIKSSRQGGALTRTDNLNALLAGNAAGETDIFSGALDYGIIAGGGYFLYITDTMDELNAQVRDISWLLIQALVLGLLLALAISWFLSKTLTRSIRALEEGAMRMSEGDFTPIEVEAGDEIGSLCSVLNRMGEQIQQDYDEFEKEEKARREFVANVSHELKTPLTVIKSYSQTLSDMEVDRDTQKEFLAVIDSEVDRMTTNVSQLLEISRLEAKKDDTQSCDIDLRTLTQGILDALKLEMRSKELTVKLTGDGTVVTVKSKATTIITNILSNAVKYTEQGGAITISINDNVLYIEDTGIGISKEDIAHIFERFYRADKARTKKTGGTGLGLSIAKECADAIGATIEVASEPRKYTRFTVTFNADK